MKRLTIAVMTAALLGIASRAGADEWKETKSYEGNFKLLLPGEPQYSREIIGQNEKIPMHIFVVAPEKHNCSFTVIYCDYSDSALQNKTPDMILDTARDGAMKPLEGKLIHESTLELAGNPGRELEFTGKQNNAPVNYVWRFYLVDNRLYQLNIASDSQVPAEDCKKFFDSFALLRK